MSLNKEQELAIQCVKEKKKFIYNITRCWLWKNLFIKCYY